MLYQYTIFIPVWGCTLSCHNVQICTQFVVMPLDSYQLTLWPLLVNSGLISYQNSWCNWSSEFGYWLLLKLSSWWEISFLLHSKCVTSELLYVVLQLPKVSGLGALISADGMINHAYSCLKIAGLLCLKLFHCMYRTVKKVDSLLFVDMLMCSQYATFVQ